MSARTVVGAVLTIVSLCLPVAVDSGCKQNQSYLTLGTQTQILEDLLGVWASPWTYLPRPPTTTAIQPLMRWTLNR
ncbi:hypothetical protein PanWU01x14_144420 [Parasponia andersonii]|uniref:Secreted protein n=1 Tax=Parasponia andersonii TaxID=3476 RepID=A0A2P5CL65_PARAD|nr:hypothetical protein PanWU01x14_144420 [Parasponia andersonii]